MSVFAVIPFRQPEKLAEKIGQEMPKGQSYQLASNVWLVNFDGTTQDLSSKLGIRGGETSSGLVLLVQNYSGRANPDIWEWFKLHWKPTE